MHLLGLVCIVCKCFYASIIEQTLVNINHNYSYRRNPTIHSLLLVLDRNLRCGYKFCFMRHAGVVDISDIQGMRYYGYFVYMAL